MAVVCPASATASPLAPAHPEDDFAGAQIRKHEGTDPGRVVELSVAEDTLGMDVSSHQGNVDWPKASRDGAKFVYIKATEGVTYTNPNFTQQYNGSYDVGMIRGAYHFALPDVSDGRTQANYFIDHGGGWSKDGRTLPPALDLEYNPYGDTCYKKSPADMVAWTRAFSDRVRERTGRLPTIYTSTSWWSKCTGNNGGFGANPLWIPRYGPEVGTLPNGWARQTIWQFADKGTLPGDQNRYAGNQDGLRSFATG
nr:lysozyme [Kutzneria albida]